MGAGACNAATRWGPLTLECTVICGTPSHDVNVATQHEFPVQAW